ncbi:MAG: crossover junction endodeoxyribonuclease RuvC [Deltaproteobacteria bacterium CG11_big_fil_rev_8_21_14_0_20_49_13]|nr:MAG: crossover junction endodeoxyribonuclease RuvC [Deltaproteobacteria bacterium CG11_big_fil_rev_8_21_14_0_20_49_13]
MIIIGIDPGTQTTGWGIVKKDGHSVTHVDNGVISPSAKLDLAQKLLHIHKELTLIIRQYKPECAAVEEVFVAKNVRSALILGHARGVALLAVSQAALPVHEYSTREIKKALVGYGNAEKAQVAMMVKNLLKLPEVASPDAADALAAAICHAQTKHFT